MISEKDLKEAIAECQGQRYPNANCCIKLAAYYTILNNLYPEEKETVFEPVPLMRTQSEFLDACSKKDITEVLEILNEHMDAIRLLYPKEYASIIERIQQI